MPRPSRASHATWTRRWGSFTRRGLSEDWRYLILEGVSLRVRRPSGRKRVPLVVAYGVRADGTRHLLGFTRNTGKSQMAWEGLLLDLYRRGLEGRQLRTTNVIERCFVEARRRTRPMVCFVNVHSVERIIFSIFNRFNLERRQHTFANLHK